MWEFDAIDVSARTVAVSSWFRSTTVLTKNDCFNCSVLHVLLYILCYFLLCACPIFVVRYTDTNHAADFNCAK